MCHTNALSSSPRLLLDSLMLLLWLCKALIVLLLASYLDKHELANKLGHQRPRLACAQGPARRAPRSSPVCTPLKKEKRMPFLSPRISRQFKSTKLGLQNEKCVCVCACVCVCVCTGVCVCVHHAAPAKLFVPMAQCDIVRVDRRSSHDRYGN